MAKFIASFTKKSDGSTEQKEFSSYDEAVAETCNYIRINAADVVSRSLQASIGTLMTYWDVSLDDISSYLNVNFIKSYYTNCKGTVTVTLAMRPTNSEREKTILNVVSIKQIV